MKDSEATPETRRRLRVEQRRTGILDAAYKVFFAKGYRETAIADIAAELGIGHGTIYRYFKNKHDIFDQVLNGALLRLATAVASEDPGATNTLEEYRAVVLRIGSRMLDLLDSDPAISQLLFYEAMGVSPELDEKVQQMWEAAGEVTEQYLDNGKTKGFLRADLDVQVTALAINALIFEGGRRVVRAADREDAKRRWLAGLTALIFDGIRP